MFSNINKSAFGTSTGTPSFGFGGTATANQTPFGQSQLFGKTNTSGFGSSAPLFGTTSQQATAPLFTNTAVPSFGAAPQQSQFGTTGLFGQQQNVTGGNGLFTGASTSTFGHQNKTAGFGFGASTATPLFGQQQTQNFQPSTSAGVFGGASSFGTTTQMGTVIKFNPVTGTDTMQKSGITHSISTKHHCITCMKEYESKSLEELRWEDYQCNRRGPQQQSGFGNTPFGPAPASTAPTLFGQTETKPAFGQTSSFGPSAAGFGMTNQQNQSTLFGKATTGFGATPTTNTFGFNTTPSFGTNAVKPFGAQPTQNVFGATATTQPTGFGTFFGQTSTQNTGGFFSKPAQTAFSTQQPVFTFGQQPTNQTNFFQPPKSTAGFGSFGPSNLTTSASFGQPSNIFSQAQQNPFNAFQKLAQPTFGQPLQQGFGLGAQAGANTFFGANKPLFGPTTQSSFFTPPTGGFMMPQQQQPAQNLSAGFDLQQPQDFHTHVEQVYEPFPHYDFLTDIASKAKTHDATNPQAIKEILEQAPMPVTAIEKNISKYRIISKPRPSYVGSKYALLDNIVDKTTTHNNFLLRNSTGKRLVLRKTAPRTEKEMMEEYKRMSSPGNNKNRSLFRNIQQLEESDSEKNGLDYLSDEYHNHTEDQENGINGKVSPKTFRHRSNGPVFNYSDYRDKRSSTESKTESTQTNGTTENQKPKNKKFPLIELTSDSDSDAKDEENLLDRLPPTNCLSTHSPPNKYANKYVNVPDPDNTLTAVGETENGIIQSPKSTGKKGVKTVRFQDNEVSSTSDLESDTGLSPGSSISLDSGDNNDTLKNDLGLLNGVDYSSSSGENSPKSRAERYSVSCGVKLDRLEYYTIPPLDELYKYKDENGACIIKGFTIGRVGYGSIYFPDTIDVSNLDLDEIIHFRYREITVYPDDDKKPPVGQGLNRHAQVTLDHVFPRDRITREIVRDVKEIAASNFTERLCLLADKQNASFLDYHPDTGSWIFTVEHFSKYQFSEAEDAECCELLEKTRREQELKQKELEKKKLEEQQETAELMKRGLGGIIPSEAIDQTTEMSITRPHSQIRATHHFKEDSRNVIIMKSSFFDEESISDDVSSSDVGIVQHFSLPTSAVSTRMIVDHGGRSRIHSIKYFALMNSQRVVPLDRSLLVSRNYMDIAVFKGKSFKVGWGQGYNLNVLTNFANYDSRVITEGYDHSASKVMRLDLGDLCGRPETMQLEEHLKVVFEESTVTTDNFGVPLFRINDGSKALVRHQQVISHLNRDPLQAYYKEVWDLCLALWGPEATSPTAKRELFSMWLEDAASSQIRYDIQLYAFEMKNIVKNIFAFLTAHQIRKAAGFAMEKDLPQLGTLISQSQEFTKVLLYNQLEQWKRSGTLNFIDRDLVKLYMLLAGIPIIEDINICENLDWKRALAIHLWYVTPKGCSIIAAIEAYKQSFSSWCYAKAPIPDHCEPEPNLEIYDILYHIMLLYGHPKMPLDKILNTYTHTRDSLDYRLSWLLSQVFAALKLGSLSEQSMDSLHVKFASQLEYMGLWNWSVFVLLFIRDTSVKTREVIAVLERNLNPDRTSKDYLKTEDMLVTQFKIPPEWIHNVLANKTEYLGKHLDSFKHLVLAKNWSRAHTIAVSNIIPDLVTSSQCDKLAKLLMDLIPGSNFINFWRNRAGLILDFLKLQQKIDATRSNITEKDKNKVTDSDVIKMKSELISICQRTKQFPTNSSKQLLAVAEISRFISVLLRLLYCEFKCTTQRDINTAVAQLKELIMPPDYKTIEIKKYVNMSINL